MFRALVPGSFDPPTHGHMNIIDRASRIFDELIVVIAVNPQKRYTFSSQERLAMMGELVEAYSNVRLTVWDRLIVELAEREGAKVMVRGVRPLGDFDYEFELSMFNRGLAGEVETVFLPSDPRYFVLRSTSIKELARLGGEVTTMVPPVVARALAKKFPRSERSGGG